VWGMGECEREMNYVDTQLNFEIVAFEHAVRTSHWSVLGVRMLIPSAMDIEPTHLLWRDWRASIGAQHRCRPSCCCSPLSRDAAWRSMENSSADPMKSLYIDLSQSSRSSAQQDPSLFTTRSSQRTYLRRQKHTLRLDRGSSYQPAQQLVWLVQTHSPSEKAVVC